MTPPKPPKQPIEALTSPEDFRDRYLYLHFLEGPGVATCKHCQHQERLLSPHYNLSAARYFMMECQCQGKCGEIYYLDTIQQKGLRENHHYKCSDCGGMIMPKWPFFCKSCRNFDFDFEPFSPDEKKSIKLTDIPYSSLDDIKTFSDSKVLWTVKKVLRQYLYYHQIYGEGTLYCTDCDYSEDEFFTVSIDSDTNRTTLTYQCCDCLKFQGMPVKQNDSDPNNIPQCTSCGGDKFRRIEPIVCPSCKGNNMKFKRIMRKIDGKGMVFSVCFPPD